MSADPQVAPYGTWSSPISARDVAGAAVRLGHLETSGGSVYWVEGRPDEGGRNVVVRRTPDGTVADLTPPPFNARTRVHEYGGGDFTVAGDLLVCAGFADQRLYGFSLRPGQDPGPSPLTAEPAHSRRYADLVADPTRRRLVCVRESHGETPEQTGPHAQPVNALVAVPLPGQAAGERVLTAGNDFYASPRVSPDGRLLAWLTWNHPNMPWDGCELWVAGLTPEGDLEGDLEGARRVAGGPDESVYQPAWGPDGRLYFVSDRSGWWNLYRLEEEADPEPLAPLPAEFGRPQWNFGTATYGFLDGETIACAFAESGVWHLGRLPLGGTLERVPTPYTSIADLRVLDGGSVVLNAASPTEPAALVRVALPSGATETLRRSSEPRLDPASVSVARPLSFPATGGGTAHAFYYPPTNPRFRAPPGERPPLLVKSHGGPTSAATAAFSLGVQYWTTRGIAVLDVNYGGSTGYGRDYRRRLDGQWGVVDVDDCVAGARALVAEGAADPQRLIVSGGSAGGYTTLCALTFRDVFRAGASYYGVSDPERLALDTHKFESRYLDRLIGPYPEARDRYLARSPVRHAGRLAAPVVFFQGLEDEVVPPSQTEEMVEALRERGVPVAYLPFPGEQHGFRRAEHIARALEAELLFYGRVFGFAPDGEVEPLEIENLPPAQ